VTTFRSPSTSVTRRMLKLCITQFGQELNQQTKHGTMLHTFMQGSCIWTHIKSHS
jgi:hypothetical protein